MHSTQQTTLAHNCLLSSHSCVLLPTDISAMKQKAFTLCIHHKGYHVVLCSPVLLNGPSCWLANKTLLSSSPCSESGDALCCDVTHVSEALDGQEPSRDGHCAHSLSTSVCQIDVAFLSNVWVHHCNANEFFFYVFFMAATDWLLWSLVSADSCHPRSSH